MSYDTRQTNAQAAQLLANRYVGRSMKPGRSRSRMSSPTTSSRNSAARGSLLGGRIYFVSDRKWLVNAEIWAMDWDGDNQKWPSPI